MTGPDASPTTRTPVPASTEVGTSEIDSDAQRDRRHSEKRERPER